MKSQQNKIVLLVEDDIAYQKLMKHIFAHQDYVTKLEIVQTGEELLQRLGCFDQNGEDSQRPDLILLDLNMPGMNGQECLKIIKEDDELKAIPVVMFTTSENEDDIMESYNLYASGYITKPTSLQDFREIIKTTCEYWFKICLTPDHRSRVKNGQNKCTISG